MDEKCENKSTGRFRGNAVLRVGLYEINLVEYWEGDVFCRGKDKSGAVYQFKKEQIIKENT